MDTKTKWVIDPVHSEVSFKIKHLVISTITGAFRKFEGTITSEGTDFSDAEVFFKIDVNSIDTNQKQRDEHLVSGDFFEVDRYPEITFISTSFVKASSVEYKMDGNLTLKGITKPIQLTVVYGGSENDGHGQVKHGFEVTAVVNRKEFGMTWNKLTDTGGLGLGEDIKLIANIQVGR
jgi:polyisoprenoid-binding protein YceI